jgi:hypothetical protein
MVYTYTNGIEQPDTAVSITKEQRIAGHAIGIIVLDVWYPLLPGNVANATSYHFPVLYRTLKGAGAEVLKGDTALLDKIIEAGKELEKQGVRAIIGSCGYFGFYQREAAAALNVPIFLSSLLQVPAIIQSLKAEQKVGIICASADSLTPNIFKACGIDNLSRVAITGAQDLPEFKNILQSRGHFNSSKLEQDLVSLAKQFTKNNPDVGAILLECSDMPPYAWAIQKAISLPVFDFMTMINWVYYAVVRRPFAGFI